MQIISDLSKVFYTGAALQDLIRSASQTRMHVEVKNLEAMERSGDTKTPIWESIALKDDDATLLAKSGYLGFIRTSMANPVVYLCTRDQAEKLSPPTTRGMENMGPQEQIGIEPRSFKPVGEDEIDDPWEVKGMGGASILIGSN